MTNDGHRYLWCYPARLSGIVELAKDEIDAISKDSDPSHQDNQVFVQHLDIDVVNNERFRYMTYVDESFS